LHASGRSGRSHRMPRCMSSTVSSSRPRLSERRCSAQGVAEWKTKRLDGYGYVESTKKPGVSSCYLLQWCG
jgi:hypothetical protein